MHEVIKCVCSQCKSQFFWDDTVLVKRKLYGIEIEERTCPKCGSKGISATKDIMFLATLATKHTFNGIN